MLLDNTEQDFAPESLPLQISADGEGQSTLLQKSDGSWWLALFRPISVYDLKTRTNRPVVPVSVQVEFEKRSNVYLYCPNRSSEPLASFGKKRKITFDLGAELLLLEIKPR